MIIVRMLMGLIFVAAAIVVLFNLVPTPELSGPVKTFNEGMAAAPYFIYVLKITELLCGIAFLVGRFVALAAVVIAPIVLQIFLFHVFMDPAGLPVAIFLLLGNIFLAYYYWDRYQPMLAAR